MRAQIYAIESVTFDGGGSLNWNGLIDIYVAQTASAGADTIEGSWSGDTLYGLGGSDTLYGKAGADSLDGGTGNDQLEGGRQGDSYFFESGDGQDTVFDDNAFSAGDDTFNFDVGITFAGAAISFDGSDPNDMLIDYGGGDQVRIDNAGAGSRYSIETFNFDGGATTHTWQQMVDEAISQAATAGSDTVYGAWTVDTVYGLGGDDTLYGRGGNDVFVFEDNNGADTIADFNTGFSEADKIDLSALTTIPDVDLSGTTNFADLSISDAGGGHALIDFGGGNSITLLNTNWLSLTDTDFIF